MKILQLIPELELGGAERGAVDVAVALNHEGIENYIASGGGRFLPHIQRHGTKHIQMPLHWRFFFFINFFRLLHLVRKEKITLIHARSRAPAWLGWAVARLTGVHFVTTFHGTYNFSWYGKKLYNSIMARGDRVIAISQFIQDHITSHYRVKSGALCVVLRGIDMVRFNPDAIHPDRLQDLARRWQLPDNCPSVLLPARFSTWKGQELLIEALAKLKDRVNFHCLLVGDSGENQAFAKRVTQLADQLGISEKVQMTGTCEDMPAALMLSDVVVSASRDPEAFGRVIVEAQAMARVTVAPAHGGALEQVTHGKTGYLFKPNDADDLAEKLEKSLQLSQARRAIIGTAARKASSRYDVKKMVKDTIAIYQDLHSSENQA